MKFILDVLSLSNLICQEFHTFFKNASNVTDIVKYNVIVTMCSLPELSMLEK